MGPPPILAVSVNVMLRGAFGCLALTIRMNSSWSRFSFSARRALSPNSFQALIRDCSSPVAVPSNWWPARVLVLTLLRGTRASGVVSEAGFVSEAGTSGFGGLKEVESARGGSWGTLAV